MLGNILTKDEGGTHVREIRLDEKDLVCRLAVIDYRMRIGTVEVWMAGIGGVHTERKYRMQGYMRRLFEDTVQYMIAEGYDVSMLFGIENFYTKFGYISSLAESICKVKTRDAEVAASVATGDYVARPIAPEDFPAVLDLYNARNADRSCSILRSPEDFTKFRKGTWYGSPPETLLWEDADGNVCGYAIWDKYPKAVKVAEVAARDMALYPTILAAFAQQAIEKRCEDISLYLPLDHPFGAYVQRFGAEWTVTYPRYGSGMLRILNQHTLFEKIAPELERRLSASTLAGFSGALALQTDLATTTLVFENGALTVCADGAAEMTLALPQDRLIQLVVGYRHVQDALIDPAVSLTGDALSLLVTLFPKGCPYPWLADHF